MTKRKRLGGTDRGPSTTIPSSSTQARKEPGVPVLSSNWLQLQTVRVADLSSFLNVRATASVDSVLLVRLFGMWCAPLFNQGQQPFPLRT